MSGFQTPIRIKDAIDRIVARKYLLPAIQRKFVWSATKVEALFDSIMQGYPINSFMFWEINSAKVKNSFKFYEFLKSYRAFFAEDNPDIDTKGFDDFIAVIDGQQRLTALYIGLKGTYAYKMPRRWWKDDEDSLPTRRLYVNLAAPLPEENERMMKYDFVFLTEWEVDEMKDDPNYIWYKVNDILNYPDELDLDDYIDAQTWKENKFAKRTVKTLYNRIFKDKLINYYLEDSQDIDTVLDIFIRTNSGGEPLSFSNLLMSITTANWKKRDARKVLPETVKKVFVIGNPNFVISEDFLLKTCLVLFSENIKFQVKNFNKEIALIFDDNWDRVEKSVIAAFTLLDSWGFNDASVRAKNAVIPIIYYIYYNNLEGVINKKTACLNEKKAMRKWLCISLLKGVFGGQSDTVLTRIRGILREFQGTGIFPFEEIKARFAGDASKNLAITDELVDGWLSIQKDAPMCYTVLALLYSHLNFDSQEKFHKDHLHPSSYFLGLKKTDFADEKDYEFYTNPENWNSIINLQLLNSLLNESKQDATLKDWVKDNNISLENQLIPTGVSLDVYDFKLFVEERKKLLAKRLKKIIEGE